VRTGVEDPTISAARGRPLDELREPVDLNSVLLTLLGAPAIADKKAVFQRYDHQVMTNTVVLPGRGDAAVIRVKGSELGIAATVSCNCLYVYLAPRLGAAHAVAEADLNLTCVSGRPLGVTDNLNVGNPTDRSVY